jgi:hypothetical protein
MSWSEPSAICSQSDVQKLFRPSEDEEADYIWTIVKSGLILVPPGRDMTESLSRSGTTISEIYLKSLLRANRSGTVMKRRVLLY